MATTKTVNKRRKRKGTRKRRRNTSTSYGSASRTQNRRRKRRRNVPQPGTRRAYASTGYRKKNPDVFSLEQITEIAPAGAGGIFFARWAVKAAGEMEDGEPGFEHAIAIMLAANIGGNIIGQILGDSRKADYARISALGWGGDLFLRKRFLKDSDWMNENLYLDGYDDDDDEEDDDVGRTGAFTDTSALGNLQIRQDNMGNKFVLTQGGYLPVENLVQGPNGEIAAMAGGAGQAQMPPGYRRISAEASGGIQPDPAVTAVNQPMGAFTDVSRIGRVQSRSAKNSFGYTV